MQNRAKKRTADRGVVIVFSSMALMAATASAQLQVGFGTEYLGERPDGTHSWQTTITNLSDVISSDYSILELDIQGALRDGNAMSTDKNWDLFSYENQALNPADNYFTINTSDWTEYLYPDPLAQENYSIMKINYTTPADYNRLSSGTITAYARSAGQIDVEGLVVTRMTETTKGTPVEWLEQVGYTNNFNAADLLDPDADGFANWQEYQADTNPTNAASYLSISITTTHLSYQGSTNCLYHLDYSTNLISNHWNIITNVPGTNGPMSHSCTNAGFYRLKAQRK